MSYQKTMLLNQQTINLINLNPIKRIFDRDPATPQRQIESYVARGQVVADLGCGAGYYTLALAACVGPEGRVYAVDLKPKAIRALEEKAHKIGYLNIETHASTAATLSFLKDGVIDFVLANGLLCTMADRRASAVREIKRILKPGAQAYLSLGWPPPLGFVNEREWEEILAGFNILRRGGGLLQKRAVVTVK